MKKVFKKLNIIIISLLMIFSNISALQASSATISVSASSSTVTVGSSFTVTIKAKSSSYFGTWEFTPSYDTSKFKLTSGETNVVWYGKAKEASYKYTFKAIATGSGTITVKSAAIRDYDTTAEMSLSKGSKTIKVVSASSKSSSSSKTTLSSNANLKNMYITGFTLEPEFNKNTTTYNVKADISATKLNIVAITEEAKATLSGDGEKELKEGENKFDIVVTAPNGSKKTYTVIINVTDQNPIEINVGADTLTVVKREKSLPTLENYKLSKVTIKEQEVPCLYNETNKFTLIGLKDKDNKINLYLYNKENNTCTIYEDANLSKMSIFPLEIEDTYKKDLKRTKVTIDDVVFNALQTNIKGFYIIKARDLSKAEDNYYEYDENTDTLIRYVEDPTLEKAFNKEISKYKKIIAILGCETVIIIVVLMGVVISRIKKNKRRKERIEEQKQKHQELEREIEEKSIKGKKKSKKKEVSDDEKKKDKNN